MIRVRWSDEMLDQDQGVFKCLNANEVKYVIIGGIAAVLHGVPRATFDLDILIEATPDNVARLLKALAEAGLGTASLTTVDGVLSHEISIFKDFVRVDVQTETPGTVFVDAWRRRATMQHGDTPFFVISRADLIATKRAAGRPVDISDVNALEGGAPGS